MLRISQQKLKLEQDMTAADAGKLLQHHFEYAEQKQLWAPNCERDQRNTIFRFIVPGVQWGREMNNLWAVEVVTFWVKMLKSNARKQNVQLKQYLISPICQHIAALTAGAMADSSQYFKCNGCWKRSLIFLLFRHTSKTLFWNQNSKGQEFNGEGI